MFRMRSGQILSNQKILLADLPGLHKLGFILYQEIESKGYLKFHAKTDKYPPERTCEILDRKITFT